MSPNVTAFFKFQVLYPIQIKYSGFIIVIIETVSLKTNKHCGSRTKKFNTPNYRPPLYMVPSQLDHLQFSQPSSLISTLILYSHLLSSFPRDFHTKILNAFLVSRNKVTCIAYCSLINFTILSIQGDLYKSQSSLLR